MKTALKVLESTWIYFLVSFYDPTNSHTNFGQKIFTLRWIATVVELGGFDFTSPFIAGKLLAFIGSKFNKKNVTKMLKIDLKFRFLGKKLDYKSKKIGTDIIL